MNPSCMQLKAPSGWFAAGAEVQRAAMLLSDGAFKLFVWLCLHAERDRGSLHVTACDLATAIRKNEDDIRICLVELVQADVCYFGSADLIVIHDSFWPYTRTTQPTYAHQQAERYVAAVKRIFLSRRCVSGAFTPADNRIAMDWHRSGIPLERAERAILLGCLRKYVTLINHGSGTPITTLGYFRSLIDEVAHIKASPDYWDYVSLRLSELERRWCRKHDRPQSGHRPEETK
jgi:hypothetical protein